MDEEAVPAAETPAEEVVSDTDDSIEFEPDIASEEDTFEDLFGDLPKIDNGSPDLTDEPEADLSVLFDDSDMQEIVPLFPTDALETATPNPEEEEEDIFPAPDPNAFDIPEGTDDEALLNELRQAFHIEFDTTVVGSDDTDEFTFLSNNDESAKDGTHDRHGDAEEEDV